MSQRQFSFVPGEFYHIYNRGTDKRVIFQDEKDYQRFQALLYLLNTKDHINVRDELKGIDGPYAVERDNPLVAIGAYCLMPNHFHILISPLDDSNLSLFMQKISTSYTMYFNKKYDRTGSLFESKFKSKLAVDDRYLKYIFSYIHLNPVKLIQADWKEKGIRDIKKIKDYLKTYSHSSYFEAVGKRRKESAILNQKLFPVYFESVQAAQQEVDEWLSFPQP
jgi:REP element-mobilizing transposase RayT